MKRGGKVVCGVTVLAVAACGGHQGTLSVRPIPTKLAAGVKPVPFRIAEARGQLALGNVALALESFRKALREDPASVDALAGLATCYDRMGRFDLSRRNYEAALAIAPADTQLLAALAGSLELQGRSAEATSVRMEITERLAAAAAADTAAPVQVVKAKPVPVVSVRRETPDVQQVADFVPPPAVQQVASIAKLPAAPSPALIAAAPAASTAFARVPISSPVPVVIAPQPVDLAELSRGPINLNLPVILAEAPVVAPGPSVTIKLPPPRPAPAAVAEPEPTEVPPAPVSVAEAQEPAAAPAASDRAPVRRLALQEKKIDRSGPRLERLSMVEVALVTVSGPRWRSEEVSRSARSTTVRFVPVRQASDLAEVRLLNAARVHRLAARTRAWLAGRGWRGVSIGDAPSTRGRSIIFYPAGQRLVARRLSDQFGFAIAPRGDVEQVTVLLGRDSIRIAGARKKA